VQHPQDASAHSTPLPFLIRFAHWDPDFLLVMSYGLRQRGLAVSAGPLTRATIDGWGAARPGVIILGLRRGNPVDEECWRYLARAGALPLITIVNGYLTAGTPDASTNGGAAAHDAPELVSLHALARRIAGVRSGGLAAAT
jgi:hypothetical protein